MNAALPTLIGQYDSPFVRRVAIAMAHYGFAFAHKPWSVFRDAEQIAQYNPLRRVPTLVLPSGEVLVESFAILDYLDEIAPASRRMVPQDGDVRRRILATCALACGLADKGVALVYERVARETGTQSSRWEARCRSQVNDTLLLLERERAETTSAWWSGATLSHADVAVGVVVHFLLQAVPNAVEALPLPRLRAHEEACHALPLFGTHDDPLNFPT